MNRGGSNPRFKDFTKEVQEIAKKYHKKGRNFAVSLPSEVLKVISDLESTVEVPKFSRIWREQIWKGMDFSFFKEQMEKDIREKEAVYRRRRA